MDHGPHPGQAERACDTRGNEVAPAQEHPQLPSPPKQRNGGHVEKCRRRPLREKAQAHAKQRGQPPDLPAQPPDCRRLGIVTSAEQEDQGRRHPQDLQCVDLGRRDLLQPEEGHRHQEYDQQGSVYPDSSSKVPLHQQHRQRRRHGGRQPGAPFAHSAPRPTCQGDGQVGSGRFRQKGLIVAQGHDPAAALQHLVGNQGAQALRSEQWPGREPIEKEHAAPSDQGQCNQQARGIVPGMG